MRIGKARYLAPVAAMVLLASACATDDGASQDDAREEQASLPGEDLNPADRDDLQDGGDFVWALSEYEEQHNMHHVQGNKGDVRRVIANNAERKPKELWSDLGEGEPVRAIEVEDEHAEARFVAAEIAALVEEGFNGREVAVFYRTNAQSRVLEDVLVRQGIAYQVIGGPRFYDRAEIKDAMAYLQAIDNPFDQVSLQRIANRPRRGIGDASLGRLAEELAEPPDAFSAHDVVRLDPALQPGHVGDMPADDDSGAGLMLAMGVPLALFAFEGMRHRARWLFRDAGGGLVWRSSAGGLRAILSESRRHGEMWDSLAQLACPTLVVRGAEVEWLDESRGAPPLLGDFLNFLAKRRRRVLTFNHCSTMDMFLMTALWPPSGAAGTTCTSQPTSMRRRKMFCLTPKS